MFVFWVSQAIVSEREARERKMIYYPFLLPCRSCDLLFRLFEENLYGFKFANYSFSLPLPPLYYLYISARRT